jgi:hypothetical protein
MNDKQLLIITFSLDRMSFLTHSMTTQALEHRAYPTIVVMARDVLCERRGDEKAKYEI